jgi:NADPH:quinone reductase-like Zn-dependent oxidoreductase
MKYKAHPNWSEEVLRLTDGTGVDLVADVAGAGTIQQSSASAKIGGTVAMIGFLSQAKPVDIVGELIYGAKICKFSPKHKRKGEAG